MSETASSSADRLRGAIASQRSRLVALARRTGGPRVDAEDVVHAAMERALARSEQLRDAGRAEAWIARAVRNATLDALRQRAHVVLPLEECDLEAPGHDDAVCGCARAQATLLKPEYASILKRVDAEGMAVSEVARELGLSANNTMVRLHRARKALRARLAEHCGTTSTRSCADCGCEERGCCPAL